MHWIIINLFWRGMKNTTVYQKCYNNPSMNTCIVCKTKLIPIVYGRLDPEILDMQDKGLVLIGLDKARGVNSFCPLCEEAYVDFTDLPSHFHG